MSLLNSKGQTNEFAAVAFLFTFGFLTILAMVLQLAFVQGFTDAGYYTGQIKETGDAFTKAISVFDYITVFFMVALIIGIGVTSYRLNTAPVFFVVTLVMGAVVGFVSYIYNYVFLQMISDSSFSVAITYFPKTILILTNLHWVALVLIVIGSITLYGKREVQAVI